MTRLFSQVLGLSVLYVGLAIASISEAIGQEAQPSSTTNSINNAVNTSGNHHSPVTRNAAKLPQAERLEASQTDTNQLQETWQHHIILANRAFREDDYATAATHFDRAYALSTKPSPTLLYNRAVTYYKLERYADSIATFKALLGEDNQPHSDAQQQWADLARYNLGLIARDQHQVIAAEKWFKQLLQAPTAPRLRVLAQSQLSAIASEDAAVAAALAKSRLSTPQKGAVLLSLGAARDDNATSLADELSSRLSGAEDTYFNFLAYGQYYVSGQRGQGTKLYGLTQVRRYNRYQSFNSQVTGIGANVEFTPNLWTLEIGGRLLHTQLDGNNLSTHYSLLTRAIRPLQSGDRKGHLEFSHQSSFVDASSRYAYIDGWQHQLRGAWQQRVGRLSVTPSLSWETNNRDNRRIGEQFYSYSPDILAASVALQWDANVKWHLYSHLTRSRAHYSGLNKMVDLGSIDKEQSRRYWRNEAKLGARYRVTKNWYVKSEYSYTDTQDNFQLYSYDKNVISLKVDYAW